MSEFEKMLFDQLADFRSEISSLRSTMQEGFADVAARLAVQESRDRPTNECQADADGKYQKKAECDSTHRDLHAATVDRSSTKLYLVVGVSMLVSTGLTIFNILA